MPTAVQAPTTAAPPVDPVRAALEDPDQLRRLTAHARAVLRGRFSEDAVQEACRRAWAARDGYDPGRGPVSAWLAGFVANVCREHTRVAAHQPVPAAGLESAVACRPDREADLADVRFQVERFLTRLPDDERAAIKLRHLEGLDYPEVADRLGITVVWARMRVSRGLKRLREIAGRHSGEGQP